VLRFNDAYEPEEEIESSPEPEKDRHAPKHSPKKRGPKPKIPAPSSSNGSPKGKPGRKPGQSGKPSKPEESESKLSLSGSKQPSSSSLNGGALSSVYLGYGAPYLLDPAMMAQYYDPRLWGAHVTPQVGGVGDAFVMQTAFPPGFAGYAAGYAANFPGYVGYGYSGAFPMQPGAPPSTAATTAMTTGPSQSNASTASAATTAGEEKQADPSLEAIVLAATEADAQVKGKEENGS
jgi:hypothetical protein